METFVFLRDIPSRRKSSEPTGWDGDRKTGEGGRAILGSEPAGWDGDLNTTGTEIGLNLSFRAHWVGWRRATISVTLTSLMGSSEPTGWDGDLSYPSNAYIYSACSEPTVWDGDA